MAEMSNMIYNFSII